MLLQTCMQWRPIDQAQVTDMRSLDVITTPVMIVRGVGALKTCVSLTDLEVLKEI